MSKKKQYAQKHNKKRNASNGRKSVITVIIAVLVLIGAFTGAMFAWKNVAFAKDSLQAIEKMVKQNIAKKDPFVILEIVPDDVTVSTTVNGIDAKGATVSKTADVNYQIGSVGFYIKGEEPATKIISSLLSDGEDGADSVFTDSESRKNIVNKTELGTVGLGYLISDDNKDAIFYNDTPKGYKELRQGEVMQYEHDCNKDGTKEVYKEATDDLLKKLVADKTFYEIKHDYDGAKGDAYIDIAKGVMKKNTPNAETKANYTLTYQPLTVEADGETVLDTTRDLSYKYLTTMTDGAFAKSADFQGVFDPWLVEASGAEATHRAVFAPVEGAVSGYEVKASNQILDGDSVTDGTPLYTYDSAKNRFLFAGFAKTSAAGVLSVTTTTQTKGLVGKAFEAPTDGADGADTPDETPEEIIYYALNFAYVSKNSGGGSLYQVSYMDKNAVKEYQINTTAEGCIVPNANGTGIIKLGSSTASIAEQLIYDYTPDKGLFHWTSEAWLDSAGRADAKVVRIRGAKIYYSLGLINRDFFKKNVFDLDDNQCDDMPIVVKTIPASQVTVDDVRKSNMLVFQGGEMTYGGMASEPVPTYKKGGNDISYDVLKAIVGRVVEEHYPVVSDYGLFPKEWDAKTDLTAENPPNAYYLTRTLILKDMDRYYKDVLCAGTEPISNPTQYGEPNTLGDYNNVNESVYNVVYTQSPNGGLLNSGFVKPVSNKEGFDPVIEQIQQENVYRAASGISGRLPETVSPATIMRYIIAYALTDSYDAKGSLHILELAPIASYTLRLETTGRDDKVHTLYKITQTNQAGEVTAKEELIKIENGDVTLTQMTTSEYIGHVEDINAHYDLVYIGSRVAAYKLANGTLVKAYQDSNGKTVYNDTAMNGLIYSNIGDTHMTEGISMKSNTNRELTRFSGNDITEEKMYALRDFIDAGFPVVVSDELVNVTTPATEDGKRAVLSVNADTVDNCSHMYDFLNDNKGKENFFRLSEMSAPLLNMYLNVARPTLNMIPGTMGDKAQTHVETLNRDSSGHYRAVYEFGIENIGIGGGDATYDFQLFVDINSDGKFSTTTETISNVELTDTAGNAVGVDGQGRYMMRGGETYRATYVLNSSHRGVLPWKIRITKNDNTNLKRADAIGYYQIKDPDGQYEKIRVLQIDSASYTADFMMTWNMEKTMADPNTVFSQLINNRDAVPFDVTIDTICGDQITPAFTEQKLGKDKAIVDLDKNGWINREEYLAFFRTYDMLVIGFADCLVAPPDEEVEAIKLYAEEGRSVLFTHDTTSPYTFEGNGWAFKYNQLLRNTFGMDRYNAWNHRTQATDDTFSIEKAYKPKSGKRQTLGENQGFNYPTIQRKLVKGNGEKPILDGIMDANNRDYDYWQFTTRSVDSINTGQITMYPYELDKNSFPVAATHGQYWQLDFTRDDDKDGESDLVVWYTLGGTDLYKKSPGDVRNNYYIFNMGNITYSGVGHSSVMGDSGTGRETENEIKLFINTLVASYESGLHDPDIRIIENYNPESRDVNSIYLSYDEQLKNITNQKINTGILDAKENVYFVAKSTSLVRNNNIKNHTFVSDLYIEVPSITGAEVLNFKGSTLYGKKVPIEGLFYKGDDGAEHEVTPDANGSYPIEPGVAYKAVVPIKELRYYSNGTTVFDETEAPLPNDGSVNARNTRRIFVTATEKIRNIRSGIETEAKASDSAAIVRVHVFDMD